MRETFSATGGAQEGPAAYGTRVSVGAKITGDRNAEAARS